jgi:hypothetical protein
MQIGKVTRNGAGASNSLAKDCPKHQAGLGRQAERVAAGVVGASKGGLT